MIKKAVRYYATLQKTNYRCRRKNARRRIIKQLNRYNKSH